MLDEEPCNIQTPHIPVRIMREATATGCANTDKSSIVSGVHCDLNMLTIKLDSSHSPSRNSSLTPALETKPRKKCSPATTRFSNPAQSCNPAQSSKPPSIFQPRLKTVIPSGAACEGVGLRRRGISLRSLAQPSHPLPLHTRHYLSPSPPPLAPSTSESPLTSVAIAPQTLDPWACNKYAQQDSPASTSCQ